MLVSYHIRIEMAVKGTLEGGDAGDTVVVNCF